MTEVNGSCRVCGLKIRPTQTKALLASFFIVIGLFSCDLMLDLFCAGSQVSCNMTDFQISLSHCLSADQIIFLAIYDCAFPKRFLANGLGGSMLAADHSSVFT